MDHPSHPFRTSVCSEYEALLLSCKKALDVYNLKHHESRARAYSPEMSEVLSDLADKYERAYARLVKHYSNCQLCHFSQHLKSHRPPRYPMATVTGRHPA
jgi:hypothetical protein